MSLKATCPPWELVLGFQKRTQAQYWDGFASETQLRLRQAYDLEQVTVPLCAACFFRWRTGVMIGYEEPTDEVGTCGLSLPPGGAGGDWGSGFAGVFTAPSPPSLTVSAWLVYSEP